MIQIRARTVFLLVACAMGLLSGLVGATVAGTMSRWYGNNLFVEGFTQARFADAGVSSAHSFTVQASTNVPIGEFTGSVISSNPIVNLNTSLEVNGARGGIINSGRIETGTPSVDTLVVGVNVGDPIVEFYTNQTGVPAADVLMASMHEDGFLTSFTPYYWSAYINAVTVAGNVYGGVVTPAVHDALVTNATFRITTGGTVGNTNASLTITDGTNTCHCEFACNTANTTINAPCADGAGTGCLYPAASAINFTISSIGDCVNGPLIQGTAAIEHIWQ